MILDQFFSTPKLSDSALFGPMPVIFVLPKAM